MQIVKYRPAKLGLGTESSSRLQPIEFSPSIINRFYNALGDLEKIHGIQQLGQTILVTATGSIRDIYGLHEYTTVSGESLLIANTSPIETVNTSVEAVSLAGFFLYNTTANAWTRETLTGLTQGTALIPLTRLKSVQMNDKIIYYDGINRPFYQVWKKNAINQQQQLHAVVERGVGASGTTNTVLKDSNITNWVTQTKVAVNDLIEFASSTINDYPVYAIITSIGTTALDMTIVGTAATGIGKSGGVLGVGSGSPYKIIDLVELNIIPQGSPPNTLVYDNIAIGAVGTNATTIVPDLTFGIIPNFTLTEIRVGDYVYNTTRAAVTIVSAVATVALTVASVKSQTAGDSFVFLKDAMPIPSFAHVHYGRLHLIDARDTTKIRVSGPNEPEDFTTFSQTLSSVTIDYGSRQPVGDKLLSMATFGRYLVVGGKQGVYATDGTNPIADVTADVIDLNPVGLFPQGIASVNSMQNTGNSFLYIGHDGLRSFISSFSSNNASTFNISPQIKSDLISEISRYLNVTDAIQLIHYPRRNWVMLKVGTNIYNYNYSPFYINGELQNFGTFTLFNSALARETNFLIRSDGSLITAGSAAGVVNIFDVSGVFKDTSANIQTTYVSPWHTLQEGQNNLNINNIDGRYIQPLFETSAQINYNISVVGDYTQLATDSVVVTSQTSGATFVKKSLRWRGRQAQITITTDTSAGSDIINSYTLYGNIFGRK